MKMDLLTNATVVNDAIRFISSNKSKEKLKPLGNSNEDEKESREHNYDDDDQLEEEKQEDKAASILTTNQVF